MSTSTALARLPQQPTEDSSAEKVPAVTSLVVPAALLLAAESVAAKPGGPATYLEGVYLHAKGDKGRVVGTDGAKMFIASFPLPTRIEGGVPPWLRDGVILSAAMLRARIQLLGKLTGEKGVVVSYAKGNPAADLSDDKASTVLKVSALHGTYPNYEASLGAKSFTDLDDDGQQESREWQPVGINSSYLKQCGDIAKTLEAGLDKDARSKLGMVVRAFNGGGADAPLVFDFSTWPGAILVVAPAVMATRMTSKETAQILAPALKMTVAALRAHATRWDQRAAELTGAGKDAATEKADEFRRRVAAILASVPAGPAIAGAKPEKAPSAEQPGSNGEAEPQQAKAEQPKAEPVAASAEAEDGAEASKGAGQSRKPATKRTRIKVPSNSQAAH